MPSGVPIVVLVGTVLGLMALRIGAFRLLIGGNALGVPPT